MNPLGPFLPFFFLAVLVVRELPDMMSTSEGGGGHGKADVVIGIVRIL